MKVVKEWFKSLIDNTDQILLKEYLQNNPEHINKQDESGQTLLHHAVLNPRTFYKTFPVIASYQPDPQVIDSWLGTPLHYAAYFSDDYIYYEDIFPKILKYCIKNGFDFSLKSQYGFAVIHIASMVVYKNSLGQIVGNNLERLLTTVPTLDVNLLSGDGFSSLYFVLAHDDLLMLGTLLLEKGADLLAHGPKAFSALQQMISDIEELNSLIAYLDADLVLDDTIMLARANNNTHYRATIIKRMEEHRQLLIDWCNTYLPERMVHFFNHSAKIRSLQRFLMPGRFSADHLKKMMIMRSYWADIEVMTNILYSGDELKPGQLNIILKHFVRILDFFNQNDLLNYLARLYDSNPIYLQPLFSQLKKSNREKESEIISLVAQAGSMEACSTILNRFRKKYRDLDDKMLLRQPPSEFITFAEMMMRSPNTVLHLQALCIFSDFNMSWQGPLKLESVVAINCALEYPNRHAVCSGDADAARTLIAGYTDNPEQMEHLHWLSYHITSIITGMSHLELPIPTQIQFLKQLQQSLSSKFAVPEHYLTSLASTARNSFFYNHARALLEEKVERGVLQIGK